MLKDTSARDSRIVLVKQSESRRFYQIDGGTEYTSVSVWKDRWFQSKYDPEYEAKRRQELYGGTFDEQLAFITARNDIAKNEGTALHQWIDNFYKFGDYKRGDNNWAFYQRYLAAVEAGNSDAICPDIEEKTWQQFLGFVREKWHWRLWRSEWAIFDESTKIAGTLDALFTIPQRDGSFRTVICDWKRFNKLRFDSRSTYVNPTQHTDINFPASNYHGAYIQLNFYQTILSRAYKINIDFMVIVRFGERCPEHQVHIAEANKDFKRIFDSI